MQYNGNDLVLMIKKAAIDVIIANKLFMEDAYGIVETISPITVRINQQILLTEAQLTLTRNVTNYTTSETINWETESAEGHTHSISGTKTTTINNDLQVGEKVLLLKCQRGQQYIVIDRVVS